jgi:hypothetical protein
MTIRDVAAYVDLLVRLVLALVVCAIVLGVGFLVLGVSVAVALGIARRLALIAIPIAAVWSFRPLWEKSARSTLETAGEVYVRVAMSILLAALIGDALGVLAPGDFRASLHASGVMLLPLMIGIWIFDRYKARRRRTRQTNMPGS